MSTQSQAKRGGKKAKMYKKHPTIQDEKEITLKEEDQDYCMVERVLGSCRYSVRCFTDGKMRLAHKRGALTRGPNKAIIGSGDVLLVSLRTYQDAKCDILVRYNPEQVRCLIKKMEIPTNCVSVERIGETTEDENQPFDFNSI